MRYSQNSMISNKNYFTFLAWIFLIALFWIISEVRANEPENIAVLELSGSGISESDLAGLTNRLRTELFKTEKFIVLERSKIDEILKEQGFQNTGCTNTACAVEIGQLIGVSKMVVGNIDKVGRIFSADIRLVDVATGKIERVATEDCKKCRVGEVLTVSMPLLAAGLAGPNGHSPEKQIEVLAAQSAPLPGKPLRWHSGMNLSLKWGMVYIPNSEGNFGELELGKTFSGKHLLGLTLCFSGDDIKGAGAVWFRNTLHFGKVIDIYTGLTAGLWPWSTNNYSYGDNGQVLNSHHVSGLLAGGPAAKVRIGYKYFHLLSDAAILLDVNHSTIFKPKFTIGFVISFL